MFQQPLEKITGKAPVKMSHNELFSELTEKTPVNSREIAIISQIINN
ncbi:hypothetical protein AB4Z45_03715 [Paenibacillus sp. MCAF9]